MNNILKQCRTCLVKSQDEMIALDSVVLPFKRLTYIKLLRSCTGLTDLPASVNRLEHPLMICLQCSRTLKEAYIYIAMARLSDMKLRAELNQEIVGTSKAADSDAAHADDKLQLKTEESSTESDNINVDDQLLLRAEEKVEAASQTSKFKMQYGEFVRGYEDQKTQHQSLVSRNSLSSDYAFRVPNSRLLIPIPTLCNRKSTADTEWQNHRQHNPKHSNTTATPKLIKPQSVDLSRKEEKTTNYSVTYVEESICDAHDTLDAMPVQQTAQQQNDLNYSIIEKENIMPLENCATTQNDANCNKEIEVLINAIKSGNGSCAGTHNSTLQHSKHHLNEATDELLLAWKRNDAIIAMNEMICGKCSAHYSNVFRFLTHIYQHKGSKPFSCSLCNYLTGYKETLRRHYQTVHSITATDETLHMEKKDDSLALLDGTYQELVYKCIKCAYLSNETKVMVEHLGYRHSIKEDFEQHIAKVFSCPDCYRTFAARKNMHIHFTHAHGYARNCERNLIEMYVCEFCDKDFSLKTSLEAHQRVCMVRAKVECRYCKKSFSSVAKFGEHISAEHGIETIHECEYCKKQFKNTNALKLHRKRHTERHFHCKFCPRNFVNGAELNSHIKTHVADKPRVITRVTVRKQFKCAFCNYKANSKQSLSAHEHKHRESLEFNNRLSRRTHVADVHAIKLGEEELATEMAETSYASRYDVFAHDKNPMNIMEIEEAEVNEELVEYGVKFEDIVKDLFA